MRRAVLACKIVWPLAWLGIVLHALPLEIWQTISARFINTAAVEQLGLFGYAAFDLGDTIFRKWHDPDPATMDPAPYRRYLLDLAARRPPPPAVAPRRKNVIYLQLEGVDGQVIGARKNGRPLMPFLDGLAARSVYFADTIDNTDSGRTTDAEFLVLTSEVPLRRPPIFVSRPLDRIPSLPKALKAAGYRTVSIHGYNGEFWRRAYAHAALGYDVNYFQDHFPHGKVIGWGIADEDVLQEAARLVAAAKEPLFLHIILLTNHHPFTYYGESIGRPLATVEESCVQSVGYVDSCIAGFFAALARSGKLADCIIAVYSDHDSSITAKLEKYLDPRPKRKFQDTVPLIISGLSRPPERVEQVTGLQDVPVIVLEDLGLPVPLTFTGNGFGHFGRTIGSLHGALQDAGDTVEAFKPPVPKEELTILALYHPERLLHP